MNLLMIAFKSIRQRALSSSLTALSVALGIMLMVAVLVINGIISDMFNQRSFGYHLIVGKGSDLQIVLSAVYRITDPDEPVPYLFYEELANHPFVEKAIPLTMGDVTEQGAFKIVGTIPDYFSLPYAPDKNYAVRTPGHFLKGRWDAVIGSRVARENDWDIGSTFKLVHGGADSDHVHDEEFTVVGVLAPTGTPNDKTVFVHMDGFFAISGHEKPPHEAIERLRVFGYELSKEREAGLLAAAVHDHKPGESHPAHDLPDELKEITAILLRMKTTAAAIQFASKINEGVKARAVNPIFPMKRLMDEVVGNIRTMLIVLTSLIIAVSGVGIFVSIYNSMSDRKREIAVMRALGARRTTVFSIILAESILLCVGGGVLGVLLGHGLVFLAAPIVEARSGILMNPFAFEPLELILLPVLVALASIVGFIPGMTAYRTDVADALAA